MIEALLFAVRDNLRSGGFGYDYATCEVMPAPGMPPPRAGNVFVAVHQGSITSDMQNALDEYYDFSVTLTMRVATATDRIGDQLLAQKLARSTGFNRRAEQLKVFLHMDWGILGDANNLMLELLPDLPGLYGFCEPARFATMESPVMVGAEWFGAEEESPEEMGLKAELLFVNARRLQAIATYS